MLDVYVTKEFLVLYRINNLRKVHSGFVGSVQKRSVSTAVNSRLCPEKLKVFQRSGVSPLSLLPGKPRISQFYLFLTLKSMCIHLYSTTRGILWKFSDLHRVTLIFSYSDALHHFLSILRRLSCYFHRGINSSSLKCQYLVFPFSRVFAFLKQKQKHLQKAMLNISTHLLSWHFICRRAVMVKGIVNWGRD